MAAEIGVEVAGFAVDIAGQLVPGKKAEKLDVPENHEFSEEILTPPPVEEIKEAKFEDLFAKSGSPRLKKLIKELKTDEEGDEGLETLELHDANMAEPSLKLLMNFLINDCKSVRNFRFGRNKVTSPIFYGWLLHHREEPFNIFRVARNGLGDKAAGSIGQALGKNAEVKTLDLARNGICDKAGYLGNGLAENEHVERLILHNNKIGPLATRSLGLALASDKTCLVFIDLTGNNIGDLGLEELMKGLEQNACLEELLIGENNLTHVAGGYIREILSFENIKLTNLELQNNKLGDQGVVLLAEGIKVNSTIEKLRLGKNSIGDEGMAKLGSNLEENVSLKELWLPGNTIGAPGAKALCSSLAKNTGVTTINLASNRLGDKGAAHIASMVAYESRAGYLETVILSDNGVGNDGAQMISNGMKQNVLGKGALKEVNLSENNISDDGAKALLNQKLEVFKELKSGYTESEEELENGNPLRSPEDLIILHLDKNPITTKAVKEMKNAMEEAGADIETFKLGSDQDRVNIVSNQGIFGVRIAESETETCFSKFLLLFAVLITWADFLTDSLVIADFFFTKEFIWFGFGVTFLTLPTVFMIFFHSKPRDPDTNLKRFFYIIINTLQLRILYESVLSITGDYTPKVEDVGEVAANDPTIPNDDKSKAPQKKVDRDEMEVIHSEKVVSRTTPQLGSVRLSESVLEAGPQAILQIHVIVYSLLRPDDVNVSSSSDAIIFISSAISIFILGQTLSDLFEKQLVKEKMGDAKGINLFIGLLPCWIYQSVAFLYRALTVALITTLFQPLIAITIIFVIFISRLLLWKLSRSNRGILFLGVACLISNSSWDKRIAARLGAFFTAMEGILSVVVLNLGTQFQQPVKDFLFGIDASFLDDLNENSQNFSILMGGLLLVYVPLFTFVVAPLHRYEDVRVGDIGDTKKMNKKFGSVRGLKNVMDNPAQDASL